MASEVTTNDLRGFKFSSSIVLAVVLILVIASVVFLMQSTGAKTDFSLVDIDGVPFRLRDFRGRVVLIDFMAIRCFPCWLAMPHLLELRGEFGEELVMLSVDVEPFSETEELLREWRDKWGADWNHALDLETPPVSQSFKVLKIPTIVILDKNGRIAHTHQGPTSSDVLAAEISELLEK